MLHIPCALACVFAVAAGLGPANVIPPPSATLPSAGMVSQSWGSPIGPGTAPLPSGDATVHLASRLRGQPAMVPTRTSSERAKLVVTSSVSQGLQGPFVAPSQNYDARVTTGKFGLSEALSVQAATTSAYGFLLLAAVSVVVASGRWWNRRPNVSESTLQAADICALEMSNYPQMAARFAVAPQSKVAMAALASELGEVTGQCLAENSATVGAIGMSTPSHASSSSRASRLTRMAGVVEYVGDNARFRVDRGTETPREASPEQLAEEPTTMPPASKDAEKVLRDFLQLAASTDRGQRLTEGLRRESEELLAFLEANNPTAAAARSPLLEGNWRLVFASEDITRCSPFFWACRRLNLRDPTPFSNLVFGSDSLVETTFAITDNIPLTKMGLATQQLSSGTLVNQVGVGVFLTGENQMTTTCSYSPDPDNDSVLLLQVEKTQVLGSGIAANVLSGIDFPSGDWFAGALGDEAKVGMQITYLDQNVRIVRDARRPDACFAYIRGD